MKDEKLSCVDCATGVCKKGEGNFPDFCRTVDMDKKIMAEAMRQYEDEENRRIAQNAARVEAEGYGVYTRVQEIVEFAEKMGYKKIGIACCVGLLEEARLFAKILRHHGFTVTGIACKSGSVPKSEIGIGEECCNVGRIMCNPILQAYVLAEEETELNVVIGLCVGHDSLFYKYAKGAVTTLVTKDRVTGHNPAAVLYQLNSYYGKLLK